MIQFVGVNSRDRGKEVFDSSLRLVLEKSKSESDYPDFNVFNVVAVTFGQKEKKKKETTEKM